MRQWVPNETELKQLFQFLNNHAHKGFNQCTITIEESISMVVLHLECHKCENRKRARKWFAFNIKQQEGIYENTN